VDQHDLVTVYIAANAAEAEIIQNALHAEGIKAFVQGDVQADTVGFGFMRATVEVPTVDADRARKFIEERERLRKEGQD
jgi:hypothetical protein